MTQLDLSDIVFEKTKEAIELNNDPLVETRKREGRIFTPLIYETKDGIEYYSPGSFVKHFNPNCERLIETLRSHLITYNCISCHKPQK